MINEKNIIPTRTIKKIIKTTNVPDLLSTKKRAQELVKNNGTGKKIIKLKPGIGLTLKKKNYGLETDAVISRGISRQEAVLNERISATMNVPHITFD